MDSRYKADHAVCAYTPKIISVGEVQSFIGRPVIGDNLLQRRFALCDFSRASEAFHVSVRRPFHD